MTVRIFVSVLLLMLLLLLLLLLSYDDHLGHGSFLASVDSIVVFVVAVVVVGGGGGLRRTSRPRINPRWHSVLRTVNERSLATYV